MRRPEDLGEELRHELSHHHIGVGDGERPAAPIAGRPRIGARGIGADAEARAVIKEDRSAAGRDGMDQHHWRAHAHACNHAFEGPLVYAVEMADIGRGAAHVEADDAGEAGDARGLNRADHPARGPRQNGVLALEQMRRGQPARGLHEQESRVCTGAAATPPLPCGERAGVRGLVPTRSVPPHPAAPRAEHPTSPRWGEVQAPRRPDRHIGGAAARDRRRPRWCRRARRISPAGSPHDSPRLARSQLRGRGALPGAHGLGCA